MKNKTNLMVNESRVRNIKNGEKKRAIWKTRKEKMILREIKKIKY